MAFLRVLRTERKKKKQRTASAAEHVNTPVVQPHTRKHALNKTGLAARNHTTHSSMNQEQRVSAPHNQSPTDDDDDDDAEAVSLRLFGMHIGFAQRGGNVSLIPPCHQ